MRKKNPTPNKWANALCKDLFAYLGIEYSRLIPLLHAKRRHAIRKIVNRYANRDTKAIQVKKTCEKFRKAGNKLTEKERSNLLAESLAIIYAKRS